MASGCRASPGIGGAARPALIAGLLAVAQSGWAAEPAPSAPTRTADFAGQGASDAARRLADWVVVSGDSHGLPFLIVDKRNARVLAFDAHGLIRGATPALLGAARGDVSPAGIGQLKLADISPDLRITPAGRFEAKLGRDLGPNDVLWIDYDAAVSLHRVVTSKPAERRLQRLASPSALDNRISYGCINVSVRFYEGVVQPLFQPANGIVYILPETRPPDSLIATLAASGK